MRKYVGIDVIAALGAVMEIGTEHYKSDFQYDIEIFKEAARAPDGENNHLLWLSRRSGTECCIEREAYLIQSYAYSSWTYYAESKTEAARAYAVVITGIQNGKVIGDLYELDYRAHVKEVKNDAMDVVKVTAAYVDGTELYLPYLTWSNNREQLFHEHGKLKSVRRHPSDEAALSQVLKGARMLRELESHPAVFKLGIKNHKKPSIRAQIAEGKEQIIKKRAEKLQKVAGKVQPELEI
jgi:hypothetical protein